MILVNVGKYSSPDFYYGCSNQIIMATFTHILIILPNFYYRQVLTQNDMPVLLRVIFNIKKEFST